MMDFLTMSEAGGLKIGTYDNYVLIDNGLGDTYNHVFITNSGEETSGLASDAPIIYKGFFSGINFHVFAGDTSSTPAATLSGHYAIYLIDNNDLYPLFALEYCGEYDNEPSEDYILLRSQEEEIKELYEEIEALKAQIKELEEGRA